MGLQPFGDSEADGALFAGRDDDIDLVVANLRAAPLTILYGPSGVGKSSLLHAGVVRRIRAQAEAAAAAGTPAPTILLHDEWAGDPAAALAARIAADAGIDGPAPPLDDAIEGWCERRSGMLLLILDQFEEYLRLHPRADALDELLPEVVERSDLRVHVLISLRDDAMSDLDRYEGRMPSLFENYLRLPQMTVEGAREAIERPVAQVNEWRAAAGDPAVALEDGLVDDVLEGLGDPRLSSIGEGVAAAAAPGETIEPAFLQLVMQRLWERDAACEPPRLTRWTLADLGGCAAIVRGHLDGAMDALTPAQREVAAAIFGYLVTPSGAKIRYAADDLAAYARRPAAEVAGVLDALSRPELRIVRRVPSPAGDPDGEGYEIFHDVLAGAVRGWGLRAQAARLERRNARLSAAVATLLAIAVALVAYAADPEPLRKLELRTVDARFDLRGGHDPDPKVVLVGVDDSAPATRAEHAKVLDAVAAAGPAAIVETFEFEDGGTPGTAELRAAISSARDRVLLATTRLDEAGRTTLFGAAVPRTSFAGASVAYSGFPIDDDGVVRDAIAEGHQTDPTGKALGKMASLAAAAVTMAGGEVEEDDFPAPIDLAGDPGSIPSVSYPDVLGGRVAPARLRDRIVVIGDTSSAAARDAGLRTAADGAPRMTPAELQANAVATVRAGLPLRDAPGAVTVVLIVALALLATALFLRLRTAMALALCVVLALLFALAAQLSFGGGTVLVVVAPLLALLVAMLANPVAARAARIARRAPT